MYLSVCGESQRLKEWGEKGGGGAKRNIYVNDERNEHMASYFSKHIKYESSKPEVPKYVIALTWDVESKHTTQCIPD